MWNYFLHLHFHRSLVRIYKGNAMEATPEVDQEEQASTQTTATAFVGRSDILDTVKQHLLKGQHVCLYGDRGIGKTAITEEIVLWLKEEKPNLRFIHVSDEMTFKNLLVQLARELHGLGLFRHPLISPEEMATLGWSQISKRTRALTLHELGSAVVTSLRGEGVLLILDSVNKVKPTDQAWLQDIIKNAVCIIATRDKDEKNLKPLPLRARAGSYPLQKRSLRHDGCPPCRTPGAKHGPEALSQSRVGCVERLSQRHP